MSEEKSEIEQLIHDDSFLRWIEGSASPFEEERWQLWVQQSEKRQALVDGIKLIVEDLSFKHIKRPELESELKKLNASIDSLSERKSASIYKLHKKKFWNSFSRVAAVILLLFTTFVVYKAFDLENFDTNSSVTVVQEVTVTATESGEKKILSLSDGSKITLNANSQLTYPTKTTDGDIEVTLKGEAYFDVINTPNDHERTFSVNVSGGKVKVLGTKFNVNSYKNDTEVYLEEGKVNLLLIGGENEVKDQYVMSPGEVSQFSVNRNGGSIVTKSADPEIYTSWIDNKLVFRDAPLTDVAERLGHIYKVKFNLDRPEYEEIMVSGSLPNNNLSVFVNALEKLLERSIVVEDSTIYLGSPINN